MHPIPGNRNRIYYAKTKRYIPSDFKRQMVQLYENGKSRTDIVEDYELSPSALDRWIKQAVNRNHEPSGRCRQYSNRYRSIFDLEHFTLKDMVKARNSLLSC